MNQDTDRCPFHSERSLFNDTPVCSTCWFGMPEATRKALQSGLIGREKFLSMAKSHYSSVQEFGGGHRKAKEK